MKIEVIYTFGEDRAEILELPDGAQMSALKALAPGNYVYMVDGLVRGDAYPLKDGERVTLMPILEGG